MRRRHWGSGSARGGRHHSAAAVDAAVVDDVLQQIRTSNDQWLRHALVNKLVDAETDCTVVLLGTCFYAPLQDQLVAAALQQLPRVDHILIEQPAGSRPEGSDPLLPYPAWLQAVMDCSAEAAAAAGSISISQQPLQQPGNWAFDLQQQLADLPLLRARVGRTIADPAEAFGFFGGLEFVQQPSSCTDVLQHCGFLPGLELAVAAQHALLTGARLSCIDAPLKLQEPWVKQLLSQVDDRIFEQQSIRYNPLTDLSANERMLPAAALAWDQQLACVAQQLDLAAQPQQQRGLEHTTQLSRAALSLYKVSKAVAAAMLSPAAAPEAIERLQRLQPLKWGHFSLRQRYMAQQIKEAAITLAGSARQQRPQQSPSSSSRGFTLVAVVGRQHVHALQQMWQDRGSRLFFERMPRSFAPSVVERLPDDADSSDSGSTGVSSNPVGDTLVSPSGA